MGPSLVSKDGSRSTFRLKPFVGIGKSLRVCLCEEPLCKDGMIAPFGQDAGTSLKTTGCEPLVWVVDADVVFKGAAKQFGITMAGGKAFAAPCNSDKLLVLDMETEEVHGLDSKVPPLHLPLPPSPQGLRDQLLLAPLWAPVQRARESVANRSLSAHPRRTPFPSPFYPIKYKFCMVLGGGFCPSLK